jgi:hypothetical protein
MNGFLNFLGMSSYTLAILFFALKPMVKKLLSIEIVIFIPLLYWSQDVALNQLEKGPLRDNKTVFCLPVAFTVTEK